jgi:hypothetical protein
MKQLELDLFWPLTQQIPLDLDYTQCYAINQYTVKNTGMTFTYGDGGNFTTTTSLVANSVRTFELHIDDAGLTVVSDNKPNLIRRLMYKLIGFKWRKS